jgi:hypothetical protein
MQCSAERISTPVLRRLMWGWRRGTQQRIAERLCMSAATVSRNLGRIMPLVEACPRCGSLTPRDLW